MKRKPILALGLALFFLFNYSVQADLQEEFEVLRKRVVEISNLRKQIRGSGHKDPTDRSRTEEYIQVARNLNQASLAKDRALLLIGEAQSLMDLQDKSPSPENLASLKKTLTEAENAKKRAQAWLEKLDQRSKKALEMEKRVHAKVDPVAILEGLEVPSDCVSLKEQPEQGLESLNKDLRELDQVFTKFIVYPISRVSPDVLVVTSDVKKILNQVQIAKEKHEDYQSEIRRELLARPEQFSEKVRERCNSLVVRFARLQKVVANQTQKIQSIVSRYEASKKTGPDRANGRAQSDRKSKPVLVGAGGFQKTSEDKQSGGAR